MFEILTYMGYALLLGVVAPLLAFLILTICLAVIKQSVKLFQRRFK